MTPTREELLLRRQSLQQRIRADALRAGQQHAIAGLAAILNAHQVPYELVPPDDASEGWSWIQAHFPIGFARVDWDRVAGAVRTGWGLDAERDATFRQLLQQGAGAPETRVLVVWGNAQKPSVRLEAGTLAELCPEFLAADFDLWVYSPAGRWLVECYHEGELCYGHAPH
jgi:hypothetical protein